jgi:pimeloyl-ACP methyl ester carboxylesterase
MTTPTQTRRVTSGAARIAYDVTGTGSDVLLLHAGVNDRRGWAHLVEALADRHRCIAPDSRGFGETTYEQEDGWSPVADAVVVLDDAGTDNVVVVACSMAGVAALGLALEHPERVAGVVLIGASVTGAPYPDADPRAEALERQAMAAEEAGDLEELGRLEAWMWLDGPTAPEGRVSGPARELFLEMNGRALAAPDPGKRAETGEAWPRLGEITVPVLVLVGELDFVELQAVLEQAAGLFPDGRFVRLPGVAHVPHLEADPTTLAEITRFVDGPGQPRG